MASVAQPVTVVDARGRVITIRKFGPIDRMRLVTAIGGKLAENSEYMGYATLAAVVVAIDGQPQLASTERQIELLVELLGEDGLAAVGDGYAHHFNANAVGETGDLENIKN